MHEGLLDLHFGTIPQDVSQPSGDNLEVSAQGPHITTNLNGVKIVDYTDPSQRFLDGVIALQIHTGGGVRMRWKNIEIKEN